MVITKPNTGIVNINTENKNQTLLLLSDIHFDSAYCERKLLKSTLDLALEKDAMILVNGDWFDLMQSRSDKRSNKSSLRPEYLGDNYFDLVIQDSVEFLKPYAKNLVIMADGNHETSITKHMESNPLDRLCFALRQLEGCKVEHTGYQSWVNVVLNTSKTAKITYKIKMHHGSGGNARVTKGVIEHNRMSTYVENADMIWLGHTHTQYCMHSTVERFHSNSKVEITLNKVYHVRTGCWKQEFKAGGWSVEKGFSPSEIGGYWLDLDIKYEINRPYVRTRIYPTY